MYQIFAEKSNGEIFECFTWNGNKEDGILRAKSDAEKFNVKISKVWAEEIKNYA